MKGWADVALNGLCVVVKAGQVKRPYSFHALRLWTWRNPLSWGFPLTRASSFSHSYQKIDSRDYWVHLAESTCIFVERFFKLETLWYLRRRTDEMSTSFDFLNKQFFERRPARFSDNHQSKKKCLLNWWSVILEVKIASVSILIVLFIVTSKNPPKRGNTRRQVAVREWQEEGTLRKNDLSLREPAL